MHRQLTHTVALLLRRLQNGRFDAPDRLFGGVAEAWESVTANAADFKVDQQYNLIQTSCSKVI